jgi:hypothetical protein
MRLVLCAFVVTLLASMTIAGCSDDDYHSGSGDGSAVSTDAGTD